MTTNDLADAIDRGELCLLLARTAAGDIAVDDIAAALTEHDRRHRIRTSYSGS